MAIAKISANAYNLASSTSQTLLSTLDTTGADGCLVTVVNYFGRTPSSVTVAGTTCTKLIERVSSGNYSVAIYGAWGFAQGTNKSIVVNWGTASLCGAAYQLLSGTDQTTFYNAAGAVFQENMSKVSGYTKAITTSSANSWVIEGAYINLHNAEDIGTITPQGTQDAFSKYGPNNLNTWVQHLVTTTSGSYTGGVSWSGNTEEYVTCLVEILAATGGGGGSPYIPKIIQS